jgi:hypothetical protein
MIESYLTKPRLPLHELRKKIKLLRRLNLRHVQIDALKTALAPILHRYIHPSPRVQAGECIFRAVLWSAKPTHKNQLTYPPAHKVNFGRCNRPGEPIFYGSVGSSAAIQELTPAHLARLVLTMWHVTKPIMVASIGYSESSFARLGSVRWPHVWWHHQRPDDPDPPAANTRENMLIDRFLADEFTKRIIKGDEWRYKLSIAIAETYLKALPAGDISTGEIGDIIGEGQSITGVQVDGLVYPSIATGSNSDNVVLHCSVADTLEFVWAQYLEISRPTGRIDEFTPKGLDYADRLSPSGEIEWIGSFPNVLAPGTDFRLDANGKELVLKDSLNQVIGKFAKPT